ncbi:MAG: C40 family peptidase [Lachnospiraceae bacterium]|nr:C40 family peptidase [Lachnospiraceae bacterium]
MVRTVLLSFVTALLFNFTITGNSILGTDNDATIRITENENGTIFELIKDGKVYRAEESVFGIANILSEALKKSAENKTPTPAPTTPPSVSQSTPTPTPKPASTPTPIPVKTTMYGVADVNSYVNIRKGPGTNYEIIGRLYNEGVCVIKETIGDWSLVESGKITGYICTTYLITGDEAEKIVNSGKGLEATVITNTSNLNVRSGPGTENKVIATAIKGKTYPVVEVLNGWVKINVNDAVTGYVSSDYVKVSGASAIYAVTVEEDNARIAKEKAETESSEASKAKAAASSAINRAVSTSASYKKKALAQLEVLNSTVVSSTASDADKKRAKLCIEALSYLGLKYVWGGTSLTKGADCSGFVQSLYKKYGYTLPRVSYDQSKNAGYTSVTADTSHLLPGDLVFYAKNGVVYHVALYIGNGLVVHASNATDGVKVSSYAMYSPYNARRVIK